MDLTIVNMTINVPFDIESQGTITLDVIYPPGLSMGDRSFKVVPPPMWNTFFNGYNLKYRGIPVMELAEMPLDTMSYKTSSNVRMVLPYADIKGSGGKPQILKPAGAPQKVYDPHSTASNKFCDLVSFGGHMRGES